MGCLGCVSAAPIGRLRETTRRPAAILRRAPGERTGLRVCGTQAHPHALGYEYADGRPGQSGLCFSCGSGHGEDSLLHYLGCAELARVFCSSEQRPTCAPSPGFWGTAAALPGASIRRGATRRSGGSGVLCSGRWLADIADHTRDVCASARWRRARGYAGVAGSRERE